MLKPLMGRSLQFNSGWPIQMTTVSVNTQLALYGSSLSATSPSAIEQITSTLLPTVGAIDTDNQYIAGLRSVSSNAGLPPTYIGAVSPWFFTHYGPKSYNKNVSALHATLLFDMY